MPWRPELSTLPVSGNRWPEKEQTNFLVIGKSLKIRFVYILSFTLGNNPWGKKLYIWSPRMPGGSCQNCFVNSQARPIHMRMVESINKRLKRKSRKQKWRKTLECYAKSARRTRGGTSRTNSPPQGRKVVKLEHHQRKMSQRSARGAMRSNKIV